MKQFSLFLICIFFSATVFGAKYNYTNLGDQGEITVVNVDESSKTSGDCVASAHSYEFEINNIRATLLLAGDGWWDGSTSARYEFPKGSGNHTIFAGGLWFTGMDDANQLRCAAQTYRTSGHDFWTGPLNQFGQIEASVCDDFDRTWTVLGDDIENFITAFQDAGGVNISASAVPPSLLQWPGRANPHLAGTPFFYDLGSLAPFFDYNGDGIYDPTAGDYPIIKQCDGVEPQYADEMVFWVFNDEGNVHARSSGAAIGVQINALAFAFQTSNDLNNMTFYTYEIAKKSSGSLSETYMGVFVDPDLGGFGDDYIGCDTSRSLGIVYNAESEDGDYGFNIPITGVDFFEGPIGDNGEQLGMSSFVYYNNSGGGDGDPVNAPEFRNYQIGLWKDGMAFTYGGTGRNLGSTDSVNFVYPSDPTLAPGPNIWSECGETGSTGGADRRFVQNSGPFTLTSGASQRITIGVISVMVDNYQSCNESFDATIGPADDLAQSLFDNCFGIIGGPDAPDLKIRELSNEVIITLINKPTSNNFAEGYEQEAAGAPFGTDNTYNFEGYRVFQLVNSQVTAQDLNDPSKAALIYQADLKNGIGTIYNFTEDQAIPGQFVSSLQVEGADNGIKRSFQVTRDQFNGENLTNHKTYYYGAIAYAHNEFLPYTGPFTDPAPQLTPYLQGIGNFNVYTAIPHIIDNRNNGTVLNSAFGESVEVRRLEGQGNGGNEIALSQETEDLVVANNFEDILTYQLGKDPIGLRVVDPLEVKDVDFELWILSSRKDTIDGEIIFIPSTTFADSTFWELRVFDTNGALIETIGAEKTIDEPYEQYIDGYGITVNVGTPNPVYLKLDDKAPIYDALSSSMESSTNWLSFLTDESQGSNSASDWLRSGVNVANPSGIFDAYQFGNEIQCVDISWTTAPIEPITNSSGLNSGTTSSGAIYTIDAVTGCVSYTPVLLPSVSFDTIVVEVCDTIDVCQTTTLIFATAEFYDVANKFGNMLNGNFAPYCLAANYADASATGDVPKYVHGPGFKHDVYNPIGTVTDNVNTLDKLHSVNIVLTTDMTKWSKCVVLETGENSNFTIGNARKGQLRQSGSIDEFGNTIAGSTGLSYFPGYAINKETGERMMLAFGESSERIDNNGGDMMWNPTSKEYDALGEQEPVFGGKHFIYVIDRSYSELDVEGVAVLFNAADFTSNTIDANVASFYEDIMYTSIPLVSQDFLPMSEGLIPSDVRINLNVETNYDVFTTSEIGNNGMPRYGFSTVGLGSEENVTSVAEDALNNIRVVPNPYYGYSSYEASQLDNLVKITNLPNECTVGVYSLDGKLVREFERAVGNAGGSSADRQEISDGQIKNQSIINLDNSLTWDLKNESAISVGSGTYIIHVNAPGIGEQVVKAAVYLRPADVNNF